MSAPVRPLAAAPAITATVAMPAGGEGSSRGLGRVGLALVGTFVLLALAGPFIAPYGPTEVAGERLAPPDADNLLGTADGGFDVASQVLLGARTSLVVAAIAGGGALALGALVGLGAGWFGGRVDAVVMRVVDVVLVVPKLPLLILAGAVIGRSLLALAVLIALISWPVTARVLRAEVRSLRRRAHLRASVGFGAGSLHVVRRHLLPELRLLLVSRLVTAAGHAVIFEAGLAFLGVGDPARVSWGSMIGAALAYPGLFYSWAWSWWLLAPMVSLVLVLLGLVFLGIAAEGGVNPRLARHGG